MVDGWGGGAHPGDGLGQQGLPTAGGSVEEEAPRRDHPQVLVDLRVPHVDQQLAQLLQGGGGAGT